MKAALKYLSHLIILFSLCVLTVYAGTAFAGESVATDEITYSTESKDEILDTTSDNEKSLNYEDVDLDSSEDVVQEIVMQKQNATGETAKETQQALLASQKQSAQDLLESDKSDADTPLIATGSNDTVDIYRLYNTSSMEHLYTKDAVEKDDLRRRGWRYEGIGWVSPISSNTPVYRVFNPVSGEHHYTLDQHEVMVLTSRFGWRNEGICWYSDDQKRRVAVYRQFNPLAGAGAHNFTSSSEEDRYLTKYAGWASEGIAWYARDYGTPYVSTSYIYLDAGHGIGSSAKNVYDSGACGSGYEEAKLTAELVSLTAKYASSLYGLSVYSNVDSNIEYWNRQADAKEHGCTSLVSFHFNASDGGGTGVESYIHNKNAAEKASELQSIMHKSLVKGIGLRDRGKKSASLAVCSGSGTGLPGVLLEICFIDNSYDMKQYQAKKDALARELAAGLFEASQNGF